MARRIPKNSQINNLFNSRTNLGYSVFKEHRDTCFRLSFRTLRRVKKVYTQVISAGQTFSSVFLIFFEDRDWF